METLDHVVSAYKSGQDLTSSEQFALALAIVASVYLRLTINHFAFGEGCEHHGIFPRIALLEHQCEPNCVRESYEDVDEEYGDDIVSVGLRVVAARDIK